MQITQAVNARMPRETPRLREALALGGTRREWEAIFDRAGSFIWDDAVLRVLENEARREEHRREQERRGLWCMPAPAASAVGRPHIFRSLFQKDISGVTGESDVWCDPDFVAVDGGSGKLQSFVDYVDSAHLLTQSTSGNQCALPAADATVNNAKTAAFVAGNANRYGGNRSVALYKFLHGSAATATIVGGFTFTPAAGVLFGTCNGSGTGVSFYQASATSMQLQMFPLSAAGANVNQTSTGWTNDGTATYACLRHASSLSPNVDLRRKNSSANTYSYGGTPSTSSSQTNFMLGSQSTGGFPATMRFRALYLFHRALNTAELGVQAQFIQAVTAIS